MLVAEKPGWEHVHFHIVPRMPDISDEHLGPGALDFLNRPKDEWVSADERARLATAVGVSVHQYLA